MLTDIRHAARLLRRSPGFTAAAVATLALGLGATTAIFTMVDAILLRPLPIAEPERVVTVHAEQGDRLSRTFTYPAFRRVRDGAADAFEAVGGSGLSGFTVTGGGEARIASAAFVSEEYFAAAGIRAARGRLFATDEHQEGTDLVVVLTDAFWRSWMTANLDVLGREMRVAGRRATIVGVAPRGFRGLRLDSPVDLFVPLAAASAVLAPGNYFSDSLVTIGGDGYSPQAWIDVTARLRPGVSIEQAESLVSTLIARPDRRGPPPAVRLIQTSSAALSPRTQADTTRFTVLLGTTVALVLLVGCANLAGLILARNEGRRREAAVRLALGARAVRLVRLFLIESLLLSLLGGLAGLVVAWWMLQAMSAFVIPGRIEIEALQLGLTGRVLLFAAGAATLTTLLAGLMPALAGSRVDVLSALKASGAGPGPGSSRAFARGALVVAQIAISLILLVTGGLFVRSLRAALATDVGTDVERLAYANVGFALAGYDRARIGSFHETLVTRLRALPEIESVTFGDLPLTSGLDSTPAFRIEGENRSLPQTAEIYCGPDYFGTVGGRLVSGRVFDARDTDASPPVVVVNEAFARLAWPGQNPIGRRISILPSRHDLEVVGVAREAKYYNLRDEGRLAVYLPWAQHHGRAEFWGTLIVRSRGEAHAGVPALLREIRAFDPLLPVSTAGTLQDRIGELAMTQRLGATFLSWFSLVALAVTIVGVYGLIAHAVARRTNEIGVRLALGAAPADVVWLMMRRSLVPAALGVLVGLAGAYALAGAAKSFLFGIPPHDWLSFAAATSGLIAAAAIASYVPARRAARVDAMAALRVE